MRFRSKAPRRRAHSNERLDDRVPARVTATSDRYQHPVQGVAGAELGSRGACSFAFVRPRPKHDAVRNLAGRDHPPQGDKQFPSECDNQNGLAHALNGGAGRYHWASALSFWNIRNRQAS